MKLLTQAGWQVVAAEDGLQALQMILADEARTINAILTDSRMPGMDGVSLLEEVFEVLPGLRAVLMSGYINDPQLVDKAKELSKSKGVSFLAKPFTIEGLLNLLPLPSGKK